MRQLSITNMRIENAEEERLWYGRLSLEAFIRDWFIFLPPLVPL